MEVIQKPYIFYTLFVGREHYAQDYFIHMPSIVVYWRNTVFTKFIPLLSINLIVNEPDKFFVYSLKVQEHSLTNNSNLFFSVVNIPPTRFLQLNTRLKPNTTLDLSLTTI